MQLWLLDTETMSRLSSVRDRGQSGIKNCQLDMCVSGGFQRIYRARLASNLRLSYLEPQWLGQTEGRGKGGSSRNAERNFTLCQMSIPFVSTKCRMRVLNSNQTFDGSMFGRILYRRISILTLSLSRQLGEGLPPWPEGGKRGEGGGREREEKGGGRERGKRRKWNDDGDE